MNYRYRIGKLNIESEIELSDAFAPFATGSTSGDISIKIVTDKDAGATEIDCAEFRVEQEQFDVWKMKNSFVFRYKPFAWECGEVSELEVDDKYQEVRLVPGCGQEYLMRLALESRLILEGYITLHSSCIIGPEGRAICMTGKSGTGKSTRAAAWVSSMQLDMISGDRPLIDVSACTAHGTPWDGKEGLHKCISAPLACILDIIRADGTEGECDFTELKYDFTESKAHILNAEEAYRILIAQTYMPMWDTDLAAAAMLNLKRLCTAVKTIQLICGPDEQSAVSSWEAIKKII